MSLQKFANIFKLDVSKAIFPYEFFHDIEDIRKTKIWPAYVNFRSSLPSEQQDFLHELDEILNLPMIYGFSSFGELISDLDLDFPLSNVEFNSPFVPLLSEERKKELELNLFLSPKMYFEQKFEFERKIEDEIFTSFLDYLVYYNGTDFK